MPSNRSTRSPDDLLLSTDGWNSRTVSELTKNSRANPQLWQKLCNHLNKARFRFLKEVTEEEQASITPYIIITVKFYHISLFSPKQFPHLKILLRKYICVNVNAHECRWHGVQNWGDQISWTWNTVWWFWAAWCGPVKAYAISLASTIHGWSCYVAQGSLEFNPTALASQVLELQACMTEPSPNKLEVNFNSLFFILHFNVGKHCTSHQHGTAPACSFIISLVKYAHAFPSECSWDWWCRWYEMGTDGLQWDSQPPCVNDSVISTSQEKSFSPGTGFFSQRDILLLMTEKGMPDEQIIWLIKRPQLTKAGILKAVYENKANMLCRSMLSTPSLKTEVCGLKRSDPGWLCPLCNVLLLQDQWFWKG